MPTFYFIFSVICLSFGIGVYVGAIFIIVSERKTKKDVN